MGRRTILLLSVMGAALLLASGVAFAAINCGGGVCKGTKKADILKGTAGYDEIYGRKGSDTLKGFGAGDRLFGQGGKDTLVGGAGVDGLFGGPGDDVLDGGADNTPCELSICGDGYGFDNNWGDDRIIDTVIPDDGEGTGGNSVRFDDVTEGLTIKLTSDSGPLPEVKNASGTATVNWDGDVIDAVFSGDGDDQIMGNSASNLISGNFGADTISSGEGNDEIDVSLHHEPGNVDTVDCGENLDGSHDDDYVSFDFGVDIVSSNCERQQPVGGDAPP